MSNTDEKTLEKRYIYKGRIINVRNDRAELPDGKEVLREVVEHPGGVAVLPLTAENEVIFVRQFRYPYYMQILEIPAGKLEHGRDPFSEGQRELREETGNTASLWYDLGKMLPSPGYATECIYLYACSGLTFKGQQLDEDEFLDLVTVPYEKAVSMVLDGTLTDGKTQAAILKYDMLRAKEMLESRLKTV